MAKFIILVIAHALRNNQIAKYNDVVDESQLTAPAFELIKQGFIQLYEEEIKDEDSGDEDDDAARLNNRKEILINLGFENIDSDDFNGLSFPDSGVNFSNEDILNVSFEDFDGFVEKATELFNSKSNVEKQAKLTADAEAEAVKAKNKAAADISKKDEVKAKLTKK